MAIQNKSIFNAEVTTVGRKSGLLRTIELRLICLDQKYFASSSKVEGKHWCQNMIKNPEVQVKAGGKSYKCRARLVTEEPLRLRALHIRDSKPLLERIVFELAPIGA